MQSLLFDCLSVNCNSIHSLHSIPSGPQCFRYTNSTPGSCHIPFSRSVEMPSLGNILKHIAQLPKSYKVNGSVAPTSSAYDPILTCRSLFAVRVAKRVSLVSRKTVEPIGVDPVVDLTMLWRITPERPARPGNIVEIGAKVFQSSHRRRCFALLAALSVRPGLFDSTSTPGCWPGPRLPVHILVITIEKYLEHRCSLGLGISNRRIDRLPWIPGYASCAAPVGHHPLGASIAFLPYAVECRRTP